MSVGKNGVDQIRAQALVLRALVLVTSAELRASNPQQALGRDIGRALYGDIRFCV